MIVQGELQTRAPRRCADAIGHLGRALRFLQTHAGFPARLRRQEFANRVEQRRARRIGGAQGVCCGEGRVEIVQIESEMGAGADQAGIVEQPAELLRRKAREARRLHLPETDARELVECAGRIGLQRVVHRPQLDSDGLAQRIGRQTTRQPGRGDGRTQSGGAEEQPPARKRPSLRGLARAPAASGVPQSSLRTHMFRKLIGGDGSPCACSLIGASANARYFGLPMYTVSPASAR